MFCSSRSKRQRTLEYSCVGKRSWTNYIFWAHFAAVRFRNGYILLKQSICKDLLHTVKSSKFQTDISIYFAVFLHSLHSFVWSLVRFKSEVRNTESRNTFSICKYGEYIILQWFNLWLTSICPQFAVKAGSRTQLDTSGGGRSWTYCKRWAHFEIPKGSYTFGSVYKQRYST